MLYIEQKFGNLITACKVVVNWIDDNNLVDEFNEWAMSKENDLCPTCIQLNNFYLSHETEENAIPFF